jgi:hypothetical protein
LDQTLAAHICNQSYSGGRVQEDQGLKPTLANNSQDPILKNTSKKGWKSVSGLGSELKPQYHKKKHL